MLKVISVNKDYNKEIDYIKQCLLNEDINFDYSANKFRVNISVEIIDTDIETLAKIKRICVECILNFFKLRYYIENVFSGKLSYAKVAFIGALVRYEREQERVILANMIKNLPVYNLDTIFICAMRDIKRGWEELTKLSSDVCKENDEENLYSIAEYMLKNRKRKAVYVFGNNYVLTDMLKGKSIEMLKIYNDKNYDLINTLIANGITTLYIESIDDNLDYCLNYLFEVKNIK